MAAVVTPVLVLQAVGSGGWKVSSPLEVSPAYRVVLIVYVVGSPVAAFTALSVMLGWTVPESVTAAAAPVVE